ncbi:MAG: DUF362 domain-containing protein [Maioricimonas sp. JB045]
MDFAGPRIGRVSSYEDTEAIGAVVRRALTSSASLQETLGKDSPLVVVKPNWVQESHEYIPDRWLPVISHPAVLVAVVETLAELMDGRGEICICDAPHTYANFDAIVARGDLPGRLERVRQRFPKLELGTLDLRREVWLRKEEVIVERRQNGGDPRGYVALNLSKDSLFYRHPGEGRFYGADYETEVVNSHHHGETHEYLIAATPVECDVFVNVPKLKTHKKTGLTCSLKNLVGINGDKNWLPHHTEGTPQRQGDEFPDESWTRQLELYTKRFGRRLMANVPGVGNWVYRKMRNSGKRMLGDSETVVRNGNWHGNDTCWRMALDLNRALLYGNRDSSWREEGAAKHYVCIVDGIIGGQGNGPIAPDPIESGVLIGGVNPAEVDATACRAMGFSPADIPIVANAFASRRWPIVQGTLDALQVFDERVEEAVEIEQVEPAVPGGFVPHFGWQALKQSA